MSLAGNSIDRTIRACQIGPKGGTYEEKEECQEEVVEVHSNGDSA